MKCKTNEYDICTCWIYWIGPMICLWKITLIIVLIIKTDPLKREKYLYFRNTQYQELSISISLYYKCVCRYLIQFPALFLWSLMSLSYYPQCPTPSPSRLLHCYVPYYSLRKLLLLFVCWAFFFNVSGAFICLWGS